MTYCFSHTAHREIATCLASLMTPLGKALTQIKIKLECEQLKTVTKLAGVFYTGGFGGHCVIRIRIAKLYVLMIIGLWHAAANAEFSIQLVDQHGQTVANAVVVVGQLNSPELTRPAAVMDQLNKRFQPHVLVIRAGQQVAFPNSDQIRHHVYSFSKPNDFEIKLYGGEAAAPVTFAQPGVVVVGCNIHDRMRGYIYVTHDEQAQVSDAQGRVFFSRKPPASIRVWHSGLSLDKTEHREFALTEQDSAEWRFELSLMAPQKPAAVRTFRSRFQ